MSSLINRVKEAEIGVQAELRKIGNPTNMQTILLVGPTGSGKTTLFYSLVSGALKVSGSRNSLRLDAEVDIDGFVIGHGGQSSTKIPNLYRHPTKNIVFCDCPGFFDTAGGDQDVPNAFSIDQVLSHTKFAKILFVVSDADISATRTKFFDNSSKFIEELIPNYESKENSVCLVITKADDYENDPIDFLPAPGPHSPSLLNFFRNHSRNLIFQFSAPPSQVTHYDTYQDKQKLMQFIYDLPSPEFSRFGIALSGEAKLSILTQASSMGSISMLLNQFKNYLINDLSGSRDQLLSWKDKIQQLMSLTIEDPSEFRSKVTNLIPSRSEYNQIYSKMEELAPWRRFIIQVNKHQILSDQNNAIKGLCTDISLELNELLRPYKIIVNNAISTQREFDKDYENDVEKYKMEWRNRCEQWKTEWLKQGGWNIPHPPGHRGPPPGPPPGPFHRGWHRGPPPGPPPPGPHPGHRGPPPHHFNPNENPPPPPSYWTGGSTGRPPCAVCGQQTKGPGKDTACPANPGKICYPDFRVNTSAPYPPSPPTNGWPGRSPPKRKTVYIENGKIKSQ